MSDKDNETQEVSQENPTEATEPQAEESKDETATRLAEIEEKNRQLFERAKKAEEAAKEAKAQLDLYQTNSSESDGYTDDDELKRKVSELERRLAEKEEAEKLQSVYKKYDVLAGKDEEFQKFREEHSGYSVEDAAKLFMVDHDLLSGKQTRKGLEKPTGGSQPSKTPGTLTSKEAKELRENNFRQYQKMLQDGTLKIKD